MYPDLAALMILMFVAAFTPGPNNLLSSYSGFNFGIKRTLPLIYGVTLGFPLLIIIINSGLIIFFKKFPALQEIIKILGSVFILYFAYKVALSKSNEEQKIKNPEPSIFIISWSAGNFLKKIINPEFIIIISNGNPKVTP